MLLVYLPFDIVTLPVIVSTLLKLTRLRETYSSTLFSSSMPQLQAPETTTIASM